MNIYCCGCGGEVSARLTDGREIYPHRADLSDVPIWVCDGCGNYVGCHRKTKDKPLGVIPTPEIRSARGKIHDLLDPLWQSGEIDRGRLYHEIACELGIQKFHTADLKTIEDCRAAYRAIQQIKKDART